MSTWPTLPRHPRDVERIADGCANHSLDAVRYGVSWYRGKGWLVLARGSCDGDSVGDLVELTSEATFSRGGLRRFTKGGEIIGMKRR